MERQRILWIALFGLILVSIWLLRPFAAFGDDALFLEVATSATARQAPADSPFLRERTVQVNWSALQPDAAEVRLNLFADANLMLERVRVDRSAVDGYVWVGRVIGVADSEVTLSVRGDVLVGSVRLNGQERYTIGFAGAAQHVIRELNRHEILEPSGTDAILPPPNAADAADLQSQSEAACEDGSVIDVMVAYTAAARDYAGGTDAVEALINLRVSEMNTANSNSQAGFAWRLVAATEVDYVESGSLMTDLDRLFKSDDGYMDNVHTVRDSADADLVSLLLAEGNSGACGLAFQMTDLQPWFAGYAFGVTAMDYADPYSCSPLTMAHEFGHSMGNAHDQDHTSTETLFPWSYGYQDSGAQFRTIMSYDCPGGCPRVNHWSNPDVQFNGAPTGVDYEAQPDRAADVVRSMSEVTETVANFRPNCEVDPPTPTPSPTATPLADESPTTTYTPVPTDTPTATATVSPPAVSPTSSPTSAPVTNTPTATSSPTPNPTVQPTNTPQPTVTRSILPAMDYRLHVPLILR